MLPELKAHVHPYSSIFDLIQVRMSTQWHSNCPTLGGSITTVPAPSTPGSESRATMTLLSTKLLSGLFEICALCCGHARRAYFRSMKLVSKTFLLHSQFIQRCLQSYAFVSHKLCVNLWQRISNCKHQTGCSFHSAFLGQYYDGNMWKSNENCCKNCLNICPWIFLLGLHHFHSHWEDAGILFHHTGWSMPLFTSLSMCCAMAAQKDAFRFLCQYEAIGKVQTAYEHRYCWKVQNQGE